MGGDVWWCKVGWAMCVGLKASGVRLSILAKRFLAGRMFVDWRFRIGLGVGTHACRLVITRRECCW